MARREVVLLEDDLTGGKAAETVRFALDGTFYEIDLNSRNAKRLRDSLATYIEAGRKVSRRVAGRGRGISADRELSRAIRAWARKTGKQVSDRGRIPQTIIDQYHAKVGR